MKVGQGAAHLLFDITKGLSRDAIRQKWEAGDYGPPGERPRASSVDQWLKHHGK